MKSFLIAALVALSLGLNAVLIVGLVSPATVAPVSGWIRPAPPAATPAPAPAAGRPAGGPSAGPAAAAEGVKWADLKSDDPATLVANLRAAGFSDTEIRAILTQQLAQKLQQHRRELAGPQKEQPWWQNPIGPSGPNPVTNPQAQAELRAMAKANSQLIDSLLGPGPASPSVTNALDRLQFAGLPPDKVEQLKLINADYGELISATQASAGGAYFPEDRARLKYFNDEKDKDIRALLTPEEYDNYQLRSSSTAQSMRSNLQLFQPTEDEFRKIFALQSAFDQKFNTSLGGIDPDLARQRAQAQADLNAEIKSVLSPERAADYEKATDSSYRQAAALVSRLELPPANAAQLWTLQKEAQQQITALRTDRTLTNEARLQALATLQQQVNSRAAGVLGGQRGLDAYKQNGGQWIQTIVPPAMPAGAAGGGGGAAGTVIFSGGGGAILGP